MELLEKLEILADAAKYDAACTSSGLDHKGGRGAVGNTTVAGCCHSFSADGRCISLLKVLLTNVCVYDCQYCVNRRSNDPPRAAFTPRELCELTMGFYRRNYIEGLFLSSAVMVSPDYTTERMIQTLRLLREEYRFGGYIHAKAIPGADPLLTQQLGLLCDRMSVNIELPSAQSLALLAPDKKKEAIFTPMAQIRDGIQVSRQELKVYRHAPRFAPAGQSTQMIVGATGESDRQILSLTQGLYEKYRLKRVFYSAYMPVSGSPLLPAPENFKPPPAAGAPALSGGLAAALLPLPGRGAAGREPARPGPPAGPQVLLGPAPSGPVPRGGEPGRLRDPAAGAWHWGEERPAHSGRPAVWTGELFGAQAYGGGAEAGPVFSHLLGAHGAGAAGAGGRHPAPSAGPGGAGRGPGGAAVPL